LRHSYKFFRPFGHSHPQNLQPRQRRDALVRGPADWSWFDPVRCHSHRLSVAGL